MPVIRKPTDKWLASLRRDEFLSQLVEELRGRKASSPRPVIFEVPILGGESYHVIAVWDRWKNVPVSTRSDIVLQAYDLFELESARGETITPRITIAIGATIEEALFDLHLLPYRIQATGAKKPGERIEKEDRDRIDEAMTREGAVMSDNTVGLFLPSEGMAEDALRRLSEEFPDVRWHLRYEDSD